MSPPSTAYGSAEPRGWDRPDRRAGGLPWPEPNSRPAGAGRRRPDVRRPRPAASGPGDRTPADGRRPDDRRPGDRRTGPVAAIGRPTPIGRDRRRRPTRRPAGRRRPASPADAGPTSPTAGRGRPGPTGRAAPTAGRRRAGGGPAAGRPPKVGRAGRNLPAAIGVGVGLGAAGRWCSLFFCRPAFLAVVAAAVGVGIWEMARAVRRSGAHPPLVPLIAGGVLIDRPGLVRRPGRADASACW